MKFDPSEAKAIAYRIKNYQSGCQVSRKFNKWQKHEQKNANYVALLIQKGFNTRQGLVSAFQNVITLADLAAKWTKT